MSPTLFGRGGPSLTSSVQQPSGAPSVQQPSGAPDAGTGAGWQQSERGGPASHDGWPGADASTARDPAELPTQLYSVVFDKLPFALALARPEGTLMDVNEAFLRLFELEREEAIGLSLAAPGLLDASFWTRATDELHRRGAIRDLEATRRAKAGPALHLAVSLDVVSIGGQDRLLITVRDVTERKRTEQALRQSEELARQRLIEIEDLYRYAPVGLCVFDRDLRWVRINEQLARINGFSVEKHLGTKLRELLPKLADRIEPPLRQILSTGQPLMDVEVGDTDPLGRPRTWLANWLPLRGESGNVVGINVVVQDVTQRVQMEAALRQARDSLEQRVRERTAELEAANEVLQRVKERLESVDRRKDEFLAMLSHELRNPLAAIHNGLGILDRVAPGGEQACRAQVIIRRQVGHMIRLVDDLLDASRVAHGKLQLQHERIDLNDLATCTALDYRAAFVKGEVALRVETAPAPVWVNGDRTRLSQVLGNLLQNAVKFTPRGGATTVSILVDADHDQAVLRVQDTGRGLTREMLPRIFEAFMQTETTLDRPKGGLGLGLAVAKGLVELHGGLIFAESDGLGQGATFTVSLPLDRTLPATASPSGAEGRSPSRRVLIIEDNADAAESLRALLVLNGHEVEIASNGPAGIAKARGFLPEIVLCDLGLPEMDGYAVARTMRADPQLGRMTLVALTGYAGAEDASKSRQAGFDVHMAKPPNLEALERVLASAKSI